MKRLLVVMGVFCEAVMMFLALSIPAQGYPQHVLYVAYQPGVINPPFPRDSITGTPLCGIPYIDSINRANGCSWFVRTGIPSLPSTMNYYHLFFKDSVDLVALTNAYLANSNVVAASPDYIAKPNFTPNDTLFKRGYGDPNWSMRCRQWAFDDAHCQLEKAWDITRGDPNVLVAVVDIGIRYNHPDLRSKLWINTLEDIHNPGSFEPWPDTSCPGGKCGDLDGVDNDVDGFVDDVIGYHFKGYSIHSYGYFKVCGTDTTWFPSAPQSPLSPVAILDDRLPCDVPPCPGGGGDNCREYLYPDSIVPSASPHVDSLGFNGAVRIPHGTWISSIAAAATNNDSGAAGAAPNCPILSITAAGTQGNYFGQAGSVMGVAWARRIAQVKNKKLIVNMSWSINDTAATLGNRFILQHQLDSADAEGIVLVSAAGNAGVDSAEFPAKHPIVLSVAATDTGDFRHDYSTYNYSVDLSAPAEHWAADSGAHLWAYLNKYPMPQSCSNEGINTSGTSLSAPFVTGVAALVKSAYPNFTPAEIRAKLRSSTDPIRFNPLGPNPVAESTIIAQGRLGTGRLNAFKALTFFGNIPNVANDTTLHDTVYVSGDITVRNGKTLRLAAGTVLRFYPGDVLKKGVDTTKTEIVVDSGGKLFIGDPSGSPVRLVSFRREIPPDSTTTNDWRGIKVKWGGYLSINNAIIRHAYAGIEDHSQYLHTIQSVRIGRCQMYGILAYGTDSLTIQGCRVDSVHANPGGYGIYVYGGPSAKGARLAWDTVWACYKAIYINSSVRPVDTCLVQASSSSPFSHTGIYADEQAYFYPDSVVHINSTSINGYFTSQHLENGIRGHAVLTSCNLISDTFPRSPLGIRNLDYNSNLKLRNTKVLDWGLTGIGIRHNNGQVTDLGVVPSDSGFNSIYTSMLTWDDETGKTIWWWYVKDYDCNSCSTPVIKAEWNYWAGCPPISTRFRGTLIERLV